MAGKLVLCRHGQSDWNLKNLFTGWTDVDLTEQGIQEALEREVNAVGDGPSTSGFSLAAIAVRRRRMYSFRESFQ